MEDKLGSFFTSEMVRGELQQMMDLQEFCMRSMTMFGALSPDKKREYFIKLRTLIEKQEIFYARLKLSDDPEAKHMLESLKMAATMFGAAPQENIEDMFKELYDRIDFMQQKLEEEGG